MSKTSDADLFETTAESVRTIAKESNGKIVAVYLNTDDKSASQVLNYLDLKSEDYPTYRILNLEKVSWLGQKIKQLKYLMVMLWNFTQKKFPYIKKLVVNLT